MAGVTISYIIGEVQLVRSDQKRRIEAIPFKKSVKLKDGDRIVTSSNSYVAELSDDPGPTQTGTMITVFSNSELVLGIKGTIRTIELVNGLFRIATEKEVITPTAELRFPHGNASFWIDVSKDGSVVVASEAAPMEIVHKKTKKGVAISFKQQVVVTQEGILEPYSVDQRFKEAYKTSEMLEQSRAKFLYVDMLERNVPQELEKFVKVIEEKTGRKMEHNLVGYQKWLKEQKEFGEWKFDEVVESELPGFKPVREEEKTTLKAIIKATIVNKLINYQGIDFKITSLEKGQEFKDRKASEGREFLVLNVEAKNNSTKQIIVFYDEEIRLINESGEIITLENYKMENNFDPQSEAKGFLLFIVAKENKKFKLQLGKKSLSKMEVEFEITEDSVS